jgi:predicted nucleic acid-binding protein
VSTYPEANPGCPGVVEVSRDTWILASELSGNLRHQGIGIPLTDLILAALALENDSVLFTSDSHFERIPEVKRFKHSIA